MPEPSKPWLQGFSLPAQEKSLPDNELTKSYKEPTKGGGEKGKIPNDISFYLFTFVFKHDVHLLTKY